MNDDLRDLCYFFRTYLDCSVGEYPFEEITIPCEPIPQIHHLMKPAQPSLPKPSAYLWGRCEGWVRIGVSHAVIIDQARGVCVDESGEVLMKWVDGSWRTDLPKFEGWGFDQVAVTHLPLDPHRMSLSGWESRWGERQERMRQRRMQSPFAENRKLDKGVDLPGMESNSQESK